MPSPKGHEYSKENTYHDSGRRRCKICRKKQSLARKENKDANMG